MELLRIAILKVPEENNDIKSHSEVPLQKWLKWKNTDNTENADNSTVVKDADQLGLSCIAGGIQNATAILEKSWQFLIKLNTCILYYLPNLALNYVPKAMKT